MITTEQIKDSGLQRLAKGSWQEGAIENASIILNSVLSEDLSPVESVRAWITEAALRNDAGKHREALQALETAAVNLDLASPYVQGTFFNERARASKALGETDLALTDYAGAALKFEEAGDQEYLGRVVNNLAGLYLLINDLPRARETIERAFGIYSSFPSEMLSQVCDTQANIFLAEGKLELALENIRRAIGMDVKNELWRQTFVETEQRIIKKLIQLLAIKAIPDLDNLAAVLVKEALIKAKGSLTNAGKIIGLDHRGVDRIINKFPELEGLRSKRRERRYGKSLIKK